MLDPPYNLALEHQSEIMTIKTRLNVMKSRNKEKERIDFMKRFKEALALRNHSEKSLAELKEIFGVSRTLIHEWRTGAKTASNYSASILAEKLDINYEWLLTGKGNIEGHQLQSAQEVAMIEQFRNLTKAGQLKVITFAFDECKANEKVPKNESDKQTSLKLVKKK